MKIVALLLATLLAATDPRVKIDVNPRVVMHGGTIKLTCRVPRDERNRKLEWGVVDYRPGSQRDLDGANARITWETYVDWMPCGAGPAYCAVQTDDGRWTRVDGRFNVVGCEP